MTTTSKPRVVIVGGGITGISAAWELQQRGIAYTLLEADSRWGGKVATEIVSLNGNKFIVDGGPESFVTRKPEAWELAHEVGMGEAIVPIGSETRNMYVLDKGKPQRLPLDPVTFFTTPLLTWRGRLRLFAEPFIAPRRDDKDESLAEYVNRRLGIEAQQKFIGPVLAGIYNADPESQSILVSSPIMREMEKEYGGLIKAVIGRAFKAKKSNGAKKPRFITFKNGVQEFVEVITSQLTGDLRLNASVKSIDRAAHGFTVTLEDGASLPASACILCSPASAASDALSALAPEASARLKQIRQTNIGTISLIYRNEDIPNLGTINGVMIPRREKRAIDAITFTSLKLPQRASAGYTLIRAYFGGAKPEMVEVSESNLIEEVRAEFKALLGITAAPLKAIPFRWARSFPQADVGHLDLVDEIEKYLPNGIYLAGSSYRGVGVPDCIRQGRDAAKKI